MADTYRCIAPFAWFKDGQPQMVTAGTIVTDSDPAYKASPASFETSEEAAEKQAARKSVKAVAVEQATAEPGEKRTVSRGKS